MKVALIYLLLGLLAGAIYGLLKHIVYVFKNHLIAQIIADIIFVIFATFIFGKANLYFFYGETRLHLLAIFALGIYLERKTLGKLFAKLFIMLYNWLSKLLNKFKLSSFGKIIFK